MLHDANLIIFQNTWECIFGENYSFDPYGSLSYSAAWLYPWWSLSWCFRECRGAWLGWTAVCLSVVFVGFVADYEAFSSVVYSQSHTANTADTFCMFTVLRVLLWHWTNLCLQLQYKKRTLLISLRRIETIVLGSSAIPKSIDLLLDTHESSDDERLASGSRRQLKKAISQALPLIIVLRQNVVFNYNFWNLTNRVVMRFHETTLSQDYLEAS